MNGLTGLTLEDEPTHPKKSTIRKVGYVRALFRDDGSARICQVQVKVTSQNPNGICVLNDYSYEYPNNYEYSNG
ncbi:9700_t:CDS:2 [Entrophospora sp. SA101]|nr:9700_t:CDS:2 [Entrophospora sp. SA101]